ncbi:5-oxoprolinase subunit PxpB [Paenibacillus hodogayensis]|uniref:5-oxoprolinase subunit PxpB n=1 Tax=Paenibacillus hodogayensis TaxID=279208 RepID=A0ABV5VUD4_9BACL
MEHNGIVSYELAPLGDSAVIVRFGDLIDMAVNRLAISFAALLENEPFPGMIECVPSYAAVAVHYDPVAVLVAIDEADRGETIGDIVCNILRRRLLRLQAVSPHKARTVTIPVCYGGEFGPDLAFVASHHDMSEEEAAAVHAAGTYTVYMIGFVPGFPYIGGLPERLATPRRSSPRTVVPAGSVGIGGAQTGIYPLASPGGWQLIGRTPLRLLRPEERSPSLLAAGDAIRFEPINREQYEAYECEENTSRTEDMR